jgi:hypothetical protein
MGWPVSFTDADWAAVSFLNMFVDAATERGNAAGLVGFSPTAVSAGDDVQNLAFIQRYAVENFTAFADPSVDPAGHDPSDGTVYTYQYLADVFSAAGLDPAHGYERRRPREIDSTSATADIQGNAAAALQRAYLTIAPYGLFICVASGNWTRELTQDVGPDVLSNYSAAPDAVADFADTVDVDGNPVVTGMQVSGDYIGPWIFEDVRDVLNVLTWTTVPVVIGDSEEKEAENFPSDSSFGAATTNAQAAYAAVASVSAGLGFFAEARAFANANSVPGQFIVHFRRNRGKLTTSGLASGTRTVQFYASAVQIATPGVFDANGDGVLENQFTLMDTAAGSLAAEAETGIIGSLTVPATPADPTGSPSDSTARGYFLGSLMGLVQWVGFTYQ